MIAPPTPTVEDFARQAVEYVRRALGMTLAYDSDTLPVLDHYLRTVESAEPAMVELVVVTAGAYFGETVRHVLGGRWEAQAENAGDWRVVLATGLSFSPVGFVAAAIARGDVADFDTDIDAPARMRPYVEEALGRMGQVSEDEFFSLCGRLDTLEHLHEVLVGVAASMLGDAASEAGEGGDEPDAADAPDEPDVADGAGGPIVN